MGSRVLSDPQKEAGLKMPGHIKLVKGAVDPDPTDFLWPTMDMKKEDQAKPYDPKASVWIQDPKTHGYKEGLLESGDITQLGMEGADLSVKMTVAVAHVKSYKKQIEEAEEIAALNLAKYRKVAGALGDAEASADANEQAMAMRKARAKSASLGL